MAPDGLLELRYYLRRCKMGYRNKTYIIFDGDNDMWAYAYMKGWANNDNVTFDFHDAHDIKPLTDRASEATVKQTLRTRLSNTKISIVIVGDNTKNLHRFVRWEIETSLDLDLPIVAVNLNGTRGIDRERCPPILRDKYVVHVPFKQAIVRYALENFPQEFANRSLNAPGDRQYPASVYQSVGL
jgi:hypothetical protein